VQSKKKTSVEIAWKFPVKLVKQIPVKKNRMSADQKSRLITEIPSLSLESSLKISDPRKEKVKRRQQQQTANLKRENFAKSRKA
jgi:hypothetical protein